jgi:hypothetical protein
LEVKQNHIWSVLLHPFEGLTASSRLVADTPRGLLLEEPSKIVADYRVIISYQNANQV